MYNWHRWLVDVWVPQNAYAGHGGKRYVKNATGMTLCVDDMKPRKLGSTLAAFILQGREARYIHELTLLSERYGFRVIGNEHDGIVTVGEVPDEAAREAAEASGMAFAVLVQKSFV